MYDECWPVRSFEEQKMFFKYLNDFLTTVGSNWLKISVPKLPQSLQKNRKILLNTFKQSSVRKICANCQGHCCSQLAALPPMDLADLFYIFVVKPDFKLPEPDWSFLRQKNKIERKDPASPLYCLFSSPKGCRLKEYRSVVCLTWACNKLLRIPKIKSLNLGYHYYSQMYHQLANWFINLRKKNFSRFSKNAIMTKILANDPTCGIHRVVAQFVSEFLKSAG